MDLERVIRELRLELKRIDQAILSLEDLAASAPKRKGRPPKWMADLRATEAPDLDQKPSKRTKASADGKAP